MHCLLFIYNTFASSITHSLSLVVGPGNLLRAQNVVPGSFHYRPAGRSSPSRGALHVHSWTCWGRKENDGFIRVWAIGITSLYILTLLRINEAITTSSAVSDHAGDTWLIRYRGKMVVQWSLKWVQWASRHVPQVDRQRIKQPGPVNTHTAKPYGLDTTWCSWSYDWHNTISAPALIIWHFNTKIWNNSFQNLPHINNAIAFSTAFKGVHF